MVDGCGSVALDETPSDIGAVVVTEAVVAIVFDVIATGVLVPSSAATDGNTTLENVIIAMKNANDIAINCERRPTTPSIRGMIVAIGCCRLSRTSRELQSTASTGSGPILLTKQFIAEDVDEENEHGDDAVLGVMEKLRICCCRVGDPRAGESESERPQ